MRIACLVLLTACARAVSTDFVTSLCLERFHTARAVAGGERLFSYCKCGVRDDDCIPLPNVGREGHTFVHHILTHYDNLSDVTVFINGGTGEGSARLVDATRMMSRIRARPEDVWYVDPGVTYVKPTRHTPKETSSQFLARAASLRCDTENGVQCCKGVCIAHCCHFTAPSTFPSGGYMLTENQTRCFWIGNTKENHAIHYDTALAPASPANFPMWLSVNWGIEFDEWDTIGWYSKALFAASRDSLRSVSKEKWRRALDALAQDINAGMEGMYLERAWRTLLVRGGL